MLKFIYQYGELVFFFLWVIAIINGIPKDAVILIAVILIEIIIFLCWVIINILFIKKRYKIRTLFNSTLWSFTNFNLFGSFKYFLDKNNIPIFLLPNAMINNIVSEDNIKFIEFIDKELSNKERQELFEYACKINSANSY